MCGRRAEDGGADALLVEVGEDEEVLLVVHEVHRLRGDRSGRPSADFRKTVAAWRW